MLVVRRREFPGSLFLGKGSALSHTWPWLLVFTIEAALVEAAFQAGMLPAKVSLTLVPFSLVGLALSIFLGFRNTACYDRWWEGRRLWGSLVNTSRTFARQIITLARPAGAEFHREMVYRVIAFVYALKAQLRTKVPFDVIDPFLPDAEVPGLKACANVPNAVVHRMGERLRDAHDAGHIDNIGLARLDETLTQLIDILGACERIKNTPVPVSYTTLTHRIVALYCAALPFGIVAEVGPLSPIVVLIVSFAFLGLDAVGTQIEDPFEEDPNDLPLEALSRLIEVNLRDLLGERPLPPLLEPVDGILP